MFHNNMFRNMSCRAMAAASSNNRRRRQQVDFLRQRAVDSISGNSTTGKGDIKKNDWGVSGSRNFRSGCFMMWETKFNVSEKQKSPQLAKANLL